MTIARGRPGDRGSELPPSRPRIALFTKVPGRLPVKTRLVRSSVLTQEEVDLLARAFLADTLLFSAERTAALSLAPLALCSDPVLTLPDLSVLFADLPARPAEASLLEVKLFAQRGAGFEERLENLVDDLAAGERPAPVLILGSDSPTLPAFLISAAVHALMRGEPVLGPTPGGGIYLIGLPADLVLRPPAMTGWFASEERTELEAVSMSLRAHAPVTVLPFHYDVDIADDLVTLLAELHSRTDPACAPNTAAVLAGLSLRLDRSPVENRAVRVTRPAGAHLALVDG